MLTSYMDVKCSNVSFSTFVCTVFISSKNHIQVLNRSSKAGAALVKTITSLNLRGKSKASVIMLFSSPVKCLSVTRENVFF